jgi:hypothetical protein
VVGGNESRLRRVLQLVTDLAQAPIAQLRILDLGAFEGLFAVELARWGATVTAVEGREASLEKMRLAKDAWGFRTWTSDSRTSDRCVPRNSASLMSCCASDCCTTLMHPTSSVCSKR